MGFAAFRDVGSFFKYAKEEDDARHAQSGRRRRQLGDHPRHLAIRQTSSAASWHFGFNQDEAGRKLFDGAWPIIAGRRIALNIRFGMPDGVSRLYEPGNEGPQWWGARLARSGPRPAVGRHSRPLQRDQHLPEDHRALSVPLRSGGSSCRPEWIGLAADTDLPLPDNVRR